MDEKTKTVAIAAVLVVLLVGFTSLILVTAGSLAYNNNVCEAEFGETDTTYVLVLGNDSKYGCCFKYHDVTYCHQSNNTYVDGSFYDKMRAIV